MIKIVRQSLKNCSMLKVMSISFLHLNT